MRVTVLPTLVWHPGACRRTRARRAPACCTDTAPCVRLVLRHVAGARPNAPPPPAHVMSCHGETGLPAQCSVWSGRGSGRLWEGVAVKAPPAQACPSRAAHKARRRFIYSPHLHLQAATSMWSSPTCAHAESAQGGAVVAAVAAQSAFRGRAEQGRTKPGHSPRAMRPGLGTKRRRNPAGGHDPDTSTDPPV